MQSHGSYYEVAVGKRAVYVRVHGLASMNNCHCLRDFLEEILAAGHAFVVVDLSRCAGMDSTFLGVLAGAATYEVNGKSPGIAVVNAGESLVRLLRNVGLTELVFVEPEAFEVPELEFAKLEEQGTAEDRLTMIHSAHERLMKISDRNEEVFGPFVAALEMEMRQRGIKI